MNLTLSLFALAGIVPTIIGVVVGGIFSLILLFVIYIALFYKKYHKVKHLLKLVSEEHKLLLTKVCMLSHFYIK
jgi:hypothetical protein